MKVNGYINDKLGTVRNFLWI